MFNKHPLRQEFFWKFLSIPSLASCTLTDPQLLQHLHLNVSQTSPNCAPNDSPPPRQTWSQFMSLPSLLPHTLLKSVVFLSHSPTWALISTMSSAFSWSPYHLSCHPLVHSLHCSQRLLPAPQWGPVPHPTLCENLHCLQDNTDARSCLMLLYSCRREQL